MIRKLTKQDERSWMKDHDEEIWLKLSEQDKKRAYWAEWKKVDEVNWI